MPVPVKFDPRELAADVRAQQAVGQVARLSWRHHNLKLSFPLPPHAAAMLELVDGRRSIAQIEAALPAAVRDAMAAAAEVAGGACAGEAGEGEKDREDTAGRAGYTAGFAEEWLSLYGALHGINKLLLAHPRHAPLRFREFQQVRAAWPLLAASCHRPCLTFRTAPQCTLLRVSDLAPCPQMARRLHAQGLPARPYHVPALCPNAARSGGESGGMGSGGSGPATRYQGIHLEDNGGLFGWSML